MISLYHKIDCNKRTNIFLKTNNKDYTNSSNVKI